MRRAKRTGGTRAGHGWGRSTAGAQGAARGAVGAHAHEVTFLTCASSGAVTRYGSAAAAMVSAAPRPPPSQPGPRSAAAPCRRPCIPAQGWARCCGPPVRRASGPHSGARRERAAVRGCCLALPEGDKGRWGCVGPRGGGGRQTGRQAGTERPAGRPFSSASCLSALWALGEPGLELRGGLGAARSATRSPGPWEGCTGLRRSFGPVLRPACSGPPQSALAGAALCLQSAGGKTELLVLCPAL